MLAARDGARDELESQLLTEALAAGKPVLGICRGAQLINVQLGGSLHQDLSRFYGEDAQLWTALPRKWVSITEGSRLGRILGGDEGMFVNALHRQAVADLGKDLHVAACSRYGVTQAIEHTEYPYLIGVQWHPEYLPQRSQHQKIFGALVEAAAQAAQVSATSHTNEASEAQKTAS